MTSPLDALFKDLMLYPEHMRPMVWIMCVLLIVGVVWGAYHTGRVASTRREQFTWRRSAWALGWALPAIHIGALIVGLLISIQPPQSGFLSGISAPNVIVLITPLIIGVQAALSFSPGDEPLIELLLTYTRPFPWLALERIGTLLALQSMIGVVGTVIAAQLTPHSGDIVTQLTHWFPAALLLAGLGLRVTVSTRQMEFGLCSVIILGVGLGVFGTVISAIYPFLWPFILFLPANMADYPLNRALLILIGLAFIASAGEQLRNSEFVLAGRCAL